MGNNEVQKNTRAKRKIVRLLSTILTFAIIAYCCVSLVFNICTIQGRDSSAVDRAIEKINGGDRSIVIDESLAEQIFRRLECQPNLFYMSHNYKYQEINYLPPFTKIILTIEDDYAPDIVSQMQEELDEATKLALSEINAESATDFEKATYVYAWVVQNIDYYNEQNSCSVYNAIVKGRAVCSGYANAMTHLLNELGVEAYTIGGTAMDDGEEVRHAWVLAYIDNEPYYFDPTWGDDSLHPELQEKYFAIAPQDFATTHVADDCFTNIASNATTNGEISSPFDCENELSKLSEIYRAYNDGALNLKDADIDRERLAKAIAENMVNGSYCEYLEINSESSYINELTGELCFDKHTSYTLGRTNSGISHLISSRKSTNYDGDGNDLYFTSESYFDLSTPTLVNRTALNGVTLGWSQSNDIMGDYTMFVRYSNLLPDEMTVKIDGDGNYIIIAEATESIIEGYFATFAPITYTTYIVGMVDKDMTSMCLYVENVQLDEGYLYDEFDAIEASSSVDVFIKLYNFGEVPEIKAPQK